MNTATAALADAATPSQRQTDIAAQLAAHLRLPPLREDLALHPGARQQDGSPSWMVEDPLRGRYYRIGWLEFEVLQRWQMGDARAVAQAVARDTLLQPRVDEVLAVRQFFAQHELLHDPERVAKAASGEIREPGLASKALHHYLMLRLPLFNPDHFLAWALPAVRPLLSAQAFGLSALAALVGLYLVLQQWDGFVSTLVDTLSWQGLLSYGLALVLAKVLHELGHAFTAKRLGLRVPRMGVALVLLFPMLYTDTGETWRLTRRRDRFAIAFAGMRMELMLAAWCTLAWSFLPEGGLRSAVFYLGTTSWVLTLAINASPFMRFDGYYMVSDATGIPNLHEEAAKAVKHWLRTRGLGWHEPVPTIEGETAPAWLLGFGLLTVVYRFFLFIGIALTVYHFFFKALGIALFLVEIWWFIARPLWVELRVWWEGRARTRLTVAWRLVAVAVVALLLVCMPWQSAVHAQGWIRAAQEHTVHAPRPARVQSLAPGGTLRASEPVLQLAALDLDLRDAQTAARMAALDSRLAVGGLGTREVDSQRSTREQLQQQWVEREGTGREASRLRLVSPVDGQAVDLPPQTWDGQVVSPQEVLARIIDPSAWTADVFVGEDELPRIAAGAAVKAYVAGVEGEVITGRVGAIDRVPVSELPSAMLADKFGGRLLTVDDPQSLKPRRSLYRVQVALDRQPTMPQARLATFVIAGERVSLASSLWRGAASALMLQASF